MKVVAITGKRECSVVERPDPRVTGEFARIKILSAPMCTEFHAYRGGDPCDCLGHEAAGEVVDVGPAACVAPRDRVVVMPQYGCGKCGLCLSGEHIHCQRPVDPYSLCKSTTGRATYAQYCIKQDWLLLPIPEGISYDHASMACCGLGPTFNAMQRMNVNAFDTVLVSGLGPVGMGAVVNAKVRGARVLAIECNPYRAALAKSIGVEAVFDPREKDTLDKIRGLTGGCGVDKSVETSSAEEAPALLVEATRPRGEMASVGWGGPVMARSIVGRGLTVHGVWHWNHLRDKDAMWHTIRQAKPLLDKVITHVLPMTRVKDAWELQLRGDCGKIILHPWE